MNKILQLCERTGIRDPEVISLKGDYSERKIYRIISREESIIAVHNENTAENDAFLSFRDSFERSGIKVPGFIAASEDKTTYFLEDLGDVTVKNYCDNKAAAGDIASVRDIYEKIIRQLVTIQTVMTEKIDYSKCYQGKIFERPDMEKDVNRFEEYFLKKYHKVYDHVKFTAFKEIIISEADRQNKDFFMYRDFQTRNIMIKNGEFFFIDFQSGRKGSFYYDLASFIYSSNTVNYEGMEKDLCRVYYNSSEHIVEDYEEFLRVLKIFACLRIMQAAGNYAYYYYTRGDTSVQSKNLSILSAIRSLSEFLGIIPFL